MAASIVTNWGKATYAASFHNNTDADGNAIVAVVYLILIDNTYPGWAGNSDPDIADINLITGRINPVAGGAGYVGNDVDRGEYTVLIDNAADRATVSFTTPPVLQAGASAINNVRGFGMVMANSIAAGKIHCLIRFDQSYNIGANQQATVLNAGLLIS